MVLGDLNDFEFSAPLTTLKGSVLYNLVDTVPTSDRYMFIFEGNSQVLDHILVSSNLFTNTTPQTDIVHLDPEYLNPASDHEGVVAGLTLPIGSLVITAASPTCGLPGTAVTLTGSGFTTATSVRFSNNVNASFGIIGDTQINTTVPAGAVTSKIQVRSAITRAFSPIRFQVKSPCL